MTKMCKANGGRNSTVLSFLHFMWNITSFDSWLKYVDDSYYKS